MKSYLLDEKIIKQDKIDEIQDGIEDEVLEAIDFAEESDFPGDEALYEDMFTGTPYIHDKK